jgi:hypothetical protein
MAMSMNLDTTPTRSDGSALCLVNEHDVPILSSTLFHERVHWLQWIGSSFGAFSAFLAEFQNGIIQGFIAEDGRQIRADSLP